MEEAVKKKRTHPKLHNVKLLPGTPFYSRQRNMLAFLAGQNTGSMLYNFRKASGLPTGDAEPMTGWDADDCKLKGHTTGHYLSAVSLAYAATGDEKYLKKAKAIVNGLAECQRAFAKSGRVHPGFLSAYDEEQFDLLEKLTKYPDIWAPYYTLDKIMSGLLDAYELTGVNRARAVLEPLGDWVYERLSRVPAETRAKMWDTYIAGEYGAMIGTMVRLHQISGKREHLEAAKMFENARLYDQMSSGKDELDGMHANQHIPQAAGALELYAATGSRKYLDIARNFERIVTGHHCYLIGGTGDEERFYAADKECGHLTEKTAESCASVNMLRLTSRLYEYEEEACSGLMEYYENTLFNHILMSCSHTHDGGTTYFLPLAPGSCKHYETEENSCCHGTGMESRFRFMSDIFSYEGEGDDAVLRIELPVSSKLNDEEKIRVTFSDSGRLEVAADADMKRLLAVRIPAWARDSFPEARDGYVFCGRLKAGQAVELEMPMELRETADPSDGRYYCIMWGPYLLGAVSDSKEFLHPDAAKLTSEERGHGQVFMDGETVLKPLHCIDKENYHIYFRR